MSNKVIDETSIAEVSEKLDAILMHTQNDLRAARWEWNCWKHNLSEAKGLLSGNMTTEKRAGLDQLIEIAERQINFWYTKLRGYEDRVDSTKVLGARTKIVQETFKFRSLNHRILEAVGSSESGLAASNPVKEIQDIRRAVFQLEAYTEITSA